LSGLAKLTRLELGDKISGVLPQGEDGLNALVSLEKLFLVYNTMTGSVGSGLDSPMSGTLPDHLVGLTSLKFFTLQHTKISGAFPLGLAGAAGLEQIRFQGPWGGAVDINGPLPVAPFSSLTYCYLAGGMGNPAYISGMIKKYEDSTCSTSVEACTGALSDTFRCCQDGGSGSFSANCQLGSDTTYCGVRYACPGGSEGVAQFPASGFSLCYGLKLSDPNVNYCLACSPGKFKLGGGLRVQKVRFGIPSA
jgi:hypothetical protein